MVGGRHPGLRKSSKLEHLRTILRSLPARRDHVRHGSPLQQASAILSCSSAWLVACGAVYGIARRSRSQRAVTRSRRPDRSHRSPCVQFGRCWQHLFGKLCIHSNSGEFETRSSAPARKSYRNGRPNLFLQFRRHAQLVKAYRLIGSGGQCGGRPNYKAAAAAQQDRLRRSGLMNLLFGDGGLRPAGAVKLCPTYNITFIVCPSDCGSDGRPLPWVSIEREFFRGEIIICVVH